MVVESFSGERGDLLVLLAVKDDQFSIVGSRKIVEIRGVGLDVEGVQSLCCSDIYDAKIGVVEAVVVDDVFKPILPPVS